MIYRLVAGTIRRSTVLEAIPRRWFYAIFHRQPKTAVNMSSLTERLSYTGTDAPEYRDADELRRVFGAHMHMSEADPSVMEDLEIDAWEAEGFGWARVRARLRFANAKDVARMRQTMVLLLENGVWRIVHVHNSNPAPNVERFGYVHQAYDDLLATVDREDPNLAASGSATVMFTDTAGSTSLAEAVGDACWAALVPEHLEAIAAVGWSRPWAMARCRPLRAPGKR